MVGEAPAAIDGKPALDESFDHAEDELTEHHAIAAE